MLDSLELLLNLSKSEVLNSFEVVINYLLFWLGGGQDQGRYKAKLKLC